MGGALLKCGSLKEMRRVSNASDLESTPATAALASNFAAWGCFATACCLLLAAALLLLGVYFCFLPILTETVLLVVDQASFDSPRVPCSGLPREPQIDFILLEKSIKENKSAIKKIGLGQLASVALDAPAKLNKKIVADFQLFRCD